MTGSMQRNKTGRKSQISGLLSVSPERLRAEDGSGANALRMFRECYVTLYKEDPLHQDQQRQTRQTENCND